MRAGQKTILYNNGDGCCLLLFSFIDTSLENFLDPDGKVIGENPVKVTCELPEGNTIIGTSNEIAVENCDSLRCFDYDIDYNILKRQLMVIKNASSSCSQTIQFACFSAPTKVIFMIKTEDSGL